MDRHVRHTVRSGPSTEAVTSETIGSRVGIEVMQEGRSPVTTSISPVRTTGTAHGQRDSNAFTDLSRAVKEAGLLRRRYGYYWTKLAAVPVVFAVAIALFVWVGLPAHLHSSFGLANSVTLVRAGLTAALGGLLLADPVPLDSASIYGGIVLLLDGIDGHLARRSGLASAFGARFDMEIDALLLLVLSALAAVAGLAGWWVLNVGLLRYAWILGGMVWPPLARDLPPSFRRRLACAAAVTCLIGALAAPAWLSSMLCAAALATLMYSFGADLLRVVRAGDNFLGRCNP